MTKEHHLYHLSFAMMLGIYTSIVTMATATERLVLDDFFKARRGGEGA